MSIIRDGIAKAFGLENDIPTSRALARENISKEMSSSFLSMLFPDCVRGDS